MRITERPAVRVLGGLAAAVHRQGGDRRRHLRLGRIGSVGPRGGVVGAIAHFRDFLIGADPMARGALWQRLYRSQYFEGGRVLTAAMSAIDIALHDIAGKALGVPVYELLGGRQRDYVPLFAVTLAPMGQPLIEAAHAASSRRAGR